MVLMIRLDQHLLVFKNQPFDVSQVMGGNAPVPSQTYRLKPELALSIGRPYMNVSRLL
jgi:hypothetical protein